MVSLISLRIWVIEPVRVLTSSMAPALQAGDIVLVLRGARVAVGDVVLVQEPGAQGRRHVKRLVAGPGQEAELSQGHLYVDGVSMEEPEPRTQPALIWTDTDCGEHPSVPVVERSGDARWLVLPGGEHGREVIPEKAVWLLGDNRGASSDSRHWGPVAHSWLRGRVWGVIWSRSACGGLRFNRIGPVAQVNGGKR
jgi:signal peptidase I